MPTTCAHFQLTQRTSLFRLVLKRLVTDGRTDSAIANTAPARRRAVINGVYFLEHLIHMNLHVSVS